MSRLSRRKLAQYTAERLLDGDKTIIDDLAALIVSERREREVGLLVHDIEGQLAERGVTIVQVESAMPVANTVKASIEKLLGGGDIRIREKIRPELIGGIKIQTPTQELDTSMQRKLYALKSRKI